MTPKRKLPEIEEDETTQNAGPLNARMIYEVIRRNGADELRRSGQPLFWSGIAAGMLISFSVLGEAIFRLSPRYSLARAGRKSGLQFRVSAGDPRADAAFHRKHDHHGFAAGGAQDDAWDRGDAAALGDVLSANVIGAGVAAAFIVFSGSFGDPLLGVVRELSDHATGFPVPTAFVKAIPAGILVAAIVWMMPGQRGNEVVVILLFTWLIAAGDFTHVVAGSVEMWVLLLTGELSVLYAALTFFLPVLAGNIVGGTAVFGLLAWGQVKAEVKPEASD